MTPEEKGALLLHEYEKGDHSILYCIPADKDGSWGEKSVTEGFCDDFAYRALPEPERETVKIYGSGNYWTKGTSPRQTDTHRITFDRIDGMPDVASIKMEKLT